MSLGHYSHVIGQFPVLQLTFTWVLLVVSSMGWGLAVLRFSRMVKEYSATTIRQSLWVGLFITTVVALTLDIVLPLGGATATGNLAGFVVFGLVIVAVVTFRLLRQSGQSLSPHWWFGALVVLGILIVYAGWAQGQPSNYDTGLYHIGAMNYARDFPLIPGLVNLHERFGFNSSMWPTSAWFGALGWTENEFRIVNGLLLSALLVEAMLRLLGSSRSRTLPGTVIVVIGSVLTLGVMAQYPGRLLSSSAQDSAALIFGLVAVGYFSDAMCRRDWWNLSSTRMALSTALVVATLGALMRPLGWVLVVGMAAVGVATSIAARGLHRALRSLVPGMVVIAVSGAVMGVRDYLMSGWLLYPAGLFGFPVDWRYPDPGLSSDRITAWARTPFQDVDTTLADSAWIGGWIQRLPTDWSIPALTALLVLSGLLWWGSRGTGDSWPLTGCLWALAPVVGLLVAWVWTAPDPRFAWAGIIGLGLVPVGFLTQEVPTSRVLAGSAAALAALVLLASVRGSWSSWSGQPVDPPVAVTTEAVMEDGSTVTVPTPPGDQCWTAYPLCRPNYESNAIERRGPNLADGFRPIPTPA